MSKKKPEELMNQLLLDLTNVVLELRRQPSLQLTNKQLDKDYDTLINTIQELTEL